MQQDLAIWEKELLIDWKNNWRKNAARFAIWEKELLIDSKNKIKGKMQQDLAIWEKELQIQ